MGFTPLEQPTKKVKIVSCSSPSFWYNDKIGQVFNVHINSVPGHQYQYRVEYVAEFDTFNMYRLITKTDCEDVNE